jgi:predicted PurR-regulated permease PerM
MVMVYIIVGLLNSIGLWMIGVEGAFTFGMITAVMTIIPYFGIIISAMLPITMTWLETGMLWQTISIVVVFAVVQYLEANLIFPYVVGRFVNLNTLVSILAIFIGGLLWGVSGMILFIPLLAVARVFMSHFPELRPWEKFLGQ